MENLLENGIHIGLSLEDYLSDPAMSASGITDLCQSPLTYWANSWMNPDKPERKHTPATKFGELMHDTFFDPDNITLAIKPEKMSFSTKEGKAWREVERERGATIIEHADGLALNMLRKAWIASGLAEQTATGIPEVSYFWTDKSGQRCKIRLDQLQPDCAFDLKTYANMMNKDIETAIAHNVANFRYHIKAYWYHLGIENMRAAARSNKLPIFFPPDDGNKINVDVINDLKSDKKTPFPLWFIFMEKGGVPNVTVRRFSSHDPITGELNAYWRAAKHDVEYATVQFSTYMDEFGTEEPWIRKAKFDTFTDEEFTAARWILDE